MSDIISGFLPVSDANSRVLILGSFPSVKSRAVSFYYGNRQNRFWKILSEFFGEAIEEGADFRRAFVLAHGIALWDIVTECEIVGSSDASIKNYKIAPIDELLRGAPGVRSILLNGRRAFDIFCENYKDIGIPYRLMPSTSPANPRLDKSIWFEALSQAFAEK